MEYFDESEHKEHDFDEISQQFEDLFEPESSVAVADEPGKTTFENRNPDSMTDEERESGILNHEGAPGFRRDDYERVVQLLTTNTLDNTYYVNQKEINEETLSALEEMAENDPKFLAQALVYAREEGLLQLVPTMGLAVLSKAEDKSHFRSAFPRIISTPDNLRELVRICKEGKIRKGFGGIVSREAKNWLRTLSEYHAIKYSGNHPSVTKNGEVVKNRYSLRDLILLARPKPEDEESSERFAWLVQRHNNPDQLTNNPRIAAYEQLKKAETDEERVAIIGKAGLPWEVVIPTVPKMTKEIWQVLMEQMPYMALLRNINNLRKYEVLDDDRNVEYIVNRLTDAQAIEKAKILPFRFYEAYQAYAGVAIKGDDYDWFTGNSYDEDSRRSEKDKPVDSRIVRALEDALELSFVNMPEISGTIAIASDVSGSMSSKINDKGATRYIDICGVFTGALLKKATGRVHALPFAGYVVDGLDLSAGDRVLETTHKLASVRGGSTAVGAPVERLIQTGQKVDTFIGITDGEDWDYGDRWYGSASGSFLKLWREYREKVNPNAQAFLIRIDPYQSANAPSEEPGVHFIYGWSDQVPQYIAKTMKGGKSQVNEVRSIKL